MTFCRSHLFGAVFCLAFLYSTSLPAQVQPSPDVAACANLSPGLIVKPTLFADLWTRLARIPAEKGEFETSKDFDSRVSENLRGLSRQYLLSAYLDLEETGGGLTGTYSYDPDTQEMGIRPSVFNSALGDIAHPEAGTGGGGVTITAHSAPAGRYIATNAMNAHIVVERTLRTEELVYDHTVSFSDQVKRQGMHLFSAGDEDYTPLFELSMPPERARAFKKQLKIYVVVSPKAPYSATDKRLIPATFDDPSEVLVKTEWIVADVTCAILTGEGGKVIATRPAGSHMATTYGPDAPSLRHAP